eukprot:481598-Alexandrium_andersonii.AAC.1
MRARTQTHEHRHTHTHTHTLHAQTRILAWRKHNARSGVSFKRDSFTLVGLAGPCCTQPDRARERFRAGGPEAQAE